VWRPDPATAALRRQVLRRAHIVRQRTRLKNQVHAILHRNLIPRCPAADLFGHKGRRWLAQQDALERPEVLRLMTVPGIDATVGLSIVAAVGDFTRFRTPEKLVAYLGLNPRVRQSGGQPASHGRITKAGSAHARGMLVEAAWSASTAPGPLRAFYQRVAARRGMQIAVVAAARTLTVLCWHRRVGPELEPWKPDSPALQHRGGRAVRTVAGSAPRFGSADLGDEWSVPATLTLCPAADSGSSWRVTCSEPSSPQSAALAGLRSPARPEVRPRSP
jgi:Transposase IS116/IS110/IS902 family